MLKGQHDDTGGRQGFAGAFWMDRITVWELDKEGRGGETKRAVVSSADRQTENARDSVCRVRKQG